MYFNILQAFLNRIFVAKNLLKIGIGYNPSVSANNASLCNARAFLWEANLSRRLK
jgi:hypothetical protein